MLSDVRDAWYYAFTSLSEAEVEAVHLEGASATALKDFVTRAVERNKALYDDRHVRIGVNLSGAEGVTPLDKSLSTGVYDVADPTNVVYTTLGSTEEFERVLDKSPKDVALMKQCITAYLMRWRLAAKRFLKTPSLFAGPEIAETLGCWFYQPGMPWLLAESADLLDALCNSNWTRVWDIRVPLSIAHCFTGAFRSKVYEKVGVAILTACDIDGYRERDGAVRLGHGGRALLDLDVSVENWDVRPLERGVLAEPSSASKVRVKCAREEARRRFAAEASLAVFNEAKKHMNNRARIALYTRNMPYLTSTRAPAELVREALPVIRKAVGVCATQRKTVEFERSSFDARDPCSEAAWIYFASRVYRDLTPLDIMTALVSPRGSLWRFVSRVGGGAPFYEFTLSDVVRKYREADVSKIRASCGQTDVDLMLLEVPSIAAKYLRLHLDGLKYLLGAGGYAEFLYGGWELIADLGPPCTFRGSEVEEVEDEEEGLMAMEVVAEEVAEEVEEEGDTTRVTLNEAGRFVDGSGNVLTNAELGRRGLISFSA